MRLDRNIVRNADLVGYVALALVYLIWGSTYLAIREAVRGDGALPPFALGAIRMGLASAILFAVAAARGDDRRLTRRGIFNAAVAGSLLWLGGNGLVIFALTRLDSGLVAILMATTPMWVAALAALRSRALPSGRVLSGLGVGFAGVVLLVAAAGVKSDAASLGGVVMCVMAALFWALGSTVASPAKSPLVSAASILWFAAIGFAVASAASGETISIPSPRAVAALAYLVVFGSAIGFVAYLVAIERLPAQLVMTHAQVNPLVAVLLGAIVLGEAVSPLVIVAAVLIALSIPLSRGLSSRSEPALPSRTRPAWGPAGRG